MCSLAGLLKNVGSILAVFALCSCGSGGGSGSSSGGNISNGNVNPGLSGKVFIGNRHGPWLLDLKTGHYSSIPGTNWESNPNYHSLADFTAFPLAYSKEMYLETIEDCQVEFGNDRDCIVTHNQAGAIASSFDIPAITMGSARFSRDASFIAVVVDDPFQSLNVYDSSGNLIRNVNPTNGIGRHQFDWLAYNELVYASGQSLFISNQSTALVSISDSSGLQPGDPAVSPDGTQVAFVIGEDTSQGVAGTIWLINTDGSSNGVAQRLTSENAVRTLHSSPFWSPDGKYIFVIDQTSIEGNAYVVPSDARNVLLSDSGNTEAIPVLSYFEETLEFQDDDPIPLSSTFTVKSSGIAWIPE